MENSPTRRLRLLPWAIGWLGVSLGLELLAIGQGSRDFGWFAYAPLNRDVVVGPAPASAYLSALCDLAR
jgi:hypothetical protein